MKALIGVVALVAGLSAASDPPNISGTWNMGVEGGHVIPVALVLKQDGKKLTGTIALPTQNGRERIEVALTGEFLDAAVTLSGTVDNGKETMKVDIAGRLLDDGSMEGTFVGHGHGSMSWTAERLKERE